MAGVPPEKEPTDKSFTFNDVFGFGKIVEKIPLQKINALMAYTLTAVIILLSVTGYLFLNKTNPDGFPTDWDMRAFFLISIIILIVAIINYINKK